MGGAGRTRRADLLLPVDIVAFMDTMLPMTVAVSFREVWARDFFEGLSFEVEAGRSALILTSGEDEGVALSRLITGLSLPSRGSLHVCGHSPGELAPAQLYQLRQEIGVVPSNGGMISNLKLWENITLPILYGTGQVSAETEKQVVDFLRRLGYSGNIMALPAHLTLYEKRVAAFIRATLSQPRIMVYGNCFEDMPVAARRVFSAAAAEFQDASAERTSLYLASSAEVARELQVDSVITVHEPLMRQTGNA